jgi:hypothetical protein
LKLEPFSLIDLRSALEYKEECFFINDIFASMLKAIVTALDDGEILRDDGESVVVNSNEDGVIPILKGSEVSTLNWEEVCKK